MGASLGQHLCLDVLHQTLAGTGEQLDGIFIGLVGTQQAVLLIAAAAVDGLGHQIVQTVDDLRTGSLQQALGTGAGVDVTGQHLLGVGQNGTGVVGQDDFHLCAAVPNEVAVILDVVHTSEGVLVLAKQFPIPLQGQHIAVGVDA